LVGAGAAGYLFKSGVLAGHSEEQSRMLMHR
jgi:hypothetical protein